nr:unnamed protein product [Digitaria exilis]
MAKLTALAIVLLVAVSATTIAVSSAHGDRALETTERVAILPPTSFVASPPTEEDEVDFDVSQEEAAADGPTAAGPDADWDGKTPVYGP